MKELDLNQIKKIEFNILQFFDEFCRKNDVKYFLSNGSLLGAVKYKGFIPWDDDVDILIPRSDYEKLLSIWQDNDKFTLITDKNNSGYLFPFAKLSDNRTVIENGSKVKMGLHIDLFPLDYWPDDKNKAVKMAKKCGFKLQMLCLSISEFKPSSSFLRTAVKYCIIILTKLIGKKILSRNLKVLQAKIHKQAGTKLMGCVSWPVYYDREVIPAEAFSDVKLVEFEGSKFPAPVGFDQYLRSLYGDYEPDPPVEKQKTHHGFKAYSLKNI